MYLLEVTISKCTIFKLKLLNKSNSTCINTNNCNSEQKTNSKPKTTLYNRVSISNSITGGMDEPEQRRLC